jgi:hypothetical protein
MLVSSKNLVMASPIFKAMLRYKGETLRIEWIRFLARNIGETWVESNHLKVIESMEI